MHILLNIDRVQPTAGFSGVLGTLFYCFHYNYPKSLFGEMSLPGKTKQSCLFQIDSKICREKSLP